MSEKPRRWFQIHLSTAVVMMFFCGVMLGLNLIAYEEVRVSRLMQHPNFCYGWPFPFLMWADQMPIWSVGPVAGAFAVLNLVVWVIAFLAVMVASEYAYRKHFVPHWGTMVIVGIAIVAFVMLHTSPANFYVPDGYHIAWVSYGWPFEVERILPPALRLGAEYPPPEIPLSGYTNPFALIGNAALLLVLGFCCEIILRWAQPKTNMPQNK